MHTIQPAGDLILRVGAPPRSEDFLVSSKSLTAASPIFRAMLNDQAWLKSQPASTLSPTGPSQPRILRLPEEDTSIFRYVLDMLHQNANCTTSPLATFSTDMAQPLEDSKGDFLPVDPKALPFDDIRLDLVHRILMVTKKYDMAGVIRPWAIKWRSSIQQTASMRHGPTLTPSTGWMKLSFVLWELGKEDTLEKLVRDLVMGCEVRKRSSLSCSVSPQDIRVEVVKGENRGSNPAETDSTDKQRLKEDDPDVLVYYPTAESEQHAFEVPVQFDCPTGPPDLGELVARRRTEVIQRMFEFVEKQKFWIGEEPRPQQLTARVRRDSKCQIAISANELLRVFDSAVKWKWPLTEVWYEPKQYYLETFRQRCLDFCGISDRILRASDRAYMERQRAKLLSTTSDMT
ncbi:hypothetical protein QBC41DRAFT_132654 [Cercophora samala]|uniref:BTB domain-containing protein n=1 Tax=Cercophora samala TaxID=330535 RepID=A0AA40DBE8_9PEZI|nr:hypothetical protein QBC41DRAFT_132654 [Cercophora samala]